MREVYNQKSKKQQQQKRRRKTNNNNKKKDLNIFSGGLFLYLGI